MGTSSGSPYTAAVDENTRQGTAASWRVSSRRGKRECCCPSEAPCRWCRDRQAGQRVLAPRQSRHQPGVEVDIPRRRSRSGPPRRAHRGVASVDRARDQRDTSAVNDREVRSVGRKALQCHRNRRARRSRAGEESGPTGDAPPTHRCATSRMRINGRADATAVARSNAVSAVAIADSGSPASRHASANHDR